MQTYRITAYVDPDDPIVLRLPENWKIGKNFEPVLQSLVIRNSARSIEVLPRDTVELQWAHGATGLDGKPAFLLMFWAEFDVFCKTETLCWLLDEEIPKHARISLVYPGPEKTPIAAHLYTEVISPEIAVMQQPKQVSASLV